MVDPNISQLGDEFSSIEISNSGVTIKQSDGAVDHNVVIPHTELVVSFGDRRLVDLADPTDNTDGATKQYIDNKKLNQLSAQTDDYSAQGFKITHLGKATVATDAASLNNSLDQFAKPVHNVNFNNMRITGLQDAVDSSDAVTLGQSMSNQWLYLQRIGDDNAPTIRSLSYYLHFSGQQPVVPTLDPSIIPSITADVATGVFNLKVGCYIFDIVTYLQYSVSNDSIQLVLLEENIPKYSFYTIRPYAGDMAIMTNLKMFVQVKDSAKNYKIQFLNNTKLSTILSGTNVLIRRLK